MIRNKNIGLFVHFYVVEIQVYDKDFILHIEEKRYIMLQDNKQKIKEVAISNELFINNTVDKMYVEYNKKIKKTLNFIQIITCNPG